jgi:hypothetical protein
MGVELKNVAGEGHHTDCISDEQFEWQAAGPLHGRVLLCFGEVAEGDEDFRCIRAVMASEVDAPGVVVVVIIAGGGAGMVVAVRDAGIPYRDIVLVFFIILGTPLLGGAGGSDRPTHRSLAVAAPIAPEVATPIALAVAAPIAGGRGADCAGSRGSDCADSGWLGCVRTLWDRPL